MSTRRRASSTSVVPQWLNSGPEPPNVPAPKLKTGTLRPDAPRLRYSMIVFSVRELFCRAGEGGIVRAALVEVDCEDGNAESGDRHEAGDEGDRTEARAVVDDHAAEPRADGIGEIEGGDVERGGQLQSAEHTDDIQS